MSIDTGSAFDGCRGIGSGAGNPARAERDAPGEERETPAAARADYDVVVVGGGPGGLAAAHEAYRGIRSPYRK